MRRKHFNMNEEIKNIYVIFWMLFVALIWFLADWIFGLGYQLYKDIFQKLEMFTIIRECFISEINVI